MWPYEVLVGLRKTMCTCTRGFIVKQKSLKVTSIESRNAVSLPVVAPSNLASLQIPYKNVNTTNIRRFHTQIFTTSLLNVKDSEAVKLKDNTPVALSDSMKEIIRNAMQSENFDQKNEDGMQEQYKKPNTMKNVPELTKKWLFSTSDKTPHKEIEKKFREPKAFLHNLFVVVANETKIPHLLSVSTKRVITNKKEVWSHTITVKWPQEMSFTSTSHSKSSASLSSSLKCLYWLDINNRIKNRAPVVYDKTEAKSVIYAPEEFSVNQNVLDKINDFLDTHENNIQQILSRTDDKETTEIDNSPIQSIQNPISHFRVDTQSRNQELKQRLQTRRNITASDLPIFQFRSQILNELENNQALVIKGDTGCGKTTQVPQFIMDHMTESGRGADCRMIVTQPRRISAISLAERVAHERNEHVGDVVGYQVRLQQRLPKQDGAILFCTTGLLLKKLQSNLGLEGCSHIIIDEAHERNVDTDMLLVLIRRAMQKNRSLKVVIMSATINADLFQDYLGCNAVEVPGRLFPVKMHFLNDILNLGIPSMNCSNYDKRLKNDDDETPVVNCLDIAELIRWISNNKPQGAILCFLPGWTHIQQVQTNLEGYNNRQIVIPLHSRIPYATQNTIFSPAPQGVRKIILATDIAETGITVPDVVYVIDSACHKEVRWHESKGVSSIDTHWVTKANINQRKGRAGRVQEGESYHFISKNQYEDLEPYPIPEVLRVSLEKTVLDCKTYSNEMAIDFLGSMPQPPRLSAVKTAVESLQTLGALDENENLTALGKRIALFTIHPKLSKALVYASIFQCLSPVTTISAALSLDTEIFFGSLNNKRRIRNSKMHYHPSSDHLAIAWIYAQWANYLNKGSQQAYTFSRRNNLHAERMMILHKVRDINLGHLQESGLINDVHQASNLDYPENKFSSLDELVRGILLAGMDQILKYRNYEFKKGVFTKAGSSMVTEDNAKAQLTPESVNYKRNEWPSPYLIYYQKTHHNERRTTLIRECSMLSPVSVILFSQGNVSGSMIQDNNNNEGKVLLEISGKTNVRLQCNEETARILLRFRDMIWSMVQYYIENNVKSENGPDYMEEPKKHMLNTLATLLSSTSESIDTSTSPDDAAESDE